jgi:hypothetical protein
MSRTFSLNGLRVPNDASITAISLSWSFGSKVSAVLASKFSKKSSCKSLEVFSLELTVDGDGRVSLCELQILCHKVREKLGLAAQRGR